MPQPTQSAVHVNRPLTMLSVAYAQAQSAFIADKVFPVVPVDKQSDLYYVYTKNDWFRDEAKPRGAGTESAGGGYNLSTASYKCDVFAFHKDIPDQVRANTDAPLNQDRAHTTLVTMKGLIAREVVFATNLMASSAAWDIKREGVASGSYSAGTNVINWDDYDHSTPVADVSRYTTAVALASGGFRPRHGVMSRSVWDVLKNHPDILGRVNGGGTVINPAIITQQLVASLFELEELLVMDAVYDTSTEGSSTNSMSFLGGDNFLVYYKPPAAAIEMPSAFYQFNWTGMFGMAGEIGARIKKFRMEANASDRIEIENAFDIKLTGADMAFLLYNLKA